MIMTDERSNENCTQIRVTTDDNFTEPESKKVKKKEKNMWMKLSRLVSIVLRINERWKENNIINVSPQYIRHPDV